MNLSDIGSKLREIADSLLEPAPMVEIPSDAELAAIDAKMIKREGSKYVLYSRDGSKRLGEFDSEEAAEDREAEIQRITSGKKNAVAIYKQADGAYRWFGWVSNRYRDRDNPPEILSSGAHQRYVAVAEEKGAYPELWLWHVPGSKVGKADWLEFADGFLMASGTFDKGKEAIAERLAASSEPLTMSHGFYRLKAMDTNGVTDAYWMFEASILPEGAEANPWTRFTAKEANVPISDAKKAFLGKYLDADTITKLEADTESLRKAAEDSGVDWKEVEAVDTPAATEPTIEPAAPALDVAAITDAVANTLVERLQIKALSEMLAGIKESTDGLPGIVERIAALEATVKELKVEDDAKVAKAIQPKAAEVFTWANYRASGSKETVLKKDDPVDETLKAAKPSGMQAFIGDLVSQMGKGG